MLRLRNVCFDWRWVILLLGVEHLNDSAESLIPQALPHSGSLFRQILGGDGTGVQELLAILAQMELVLLKW